MEFKGHDETEFCNKNSNAFPEREEKVVRIFLNLYI